MACKNKTCLCREKKLLKISKQPRARDEWLCEHGVGHPFPGAEEKHHAKGIHGCDGCCNLSCKCREVK